MAAVVALRAYLTGVIGLAENERANAVMDEGIDSFDALAEFGDGDIKTLCSSVRKPGGVVQLAAGGVIPNPGHNIPAICETRLVIAAYGANIYNLIGRTINQDTLSAPRLRELKRYKNTVDEADEADALPVLSNNFGIMKALDVIPSTLRQIMGVNKVPLSYVIRDDAQPGPLQPLGLNVPWGQNYTSLSDELIAHAPHNGPGYQADNATVFRKLQEMLKDSTHVTSLKPFQRRRDGRGAYMALQLHNMGESKWDKLIEVAEDMVQRRIWNGKNARYPLKSHIVKHREAHNDMVRASQFTAYVPPNGHTRVSRLLKSIECTDPSIAAAKTTILADPGKRDDFEQAADFLLLAAPTKHTQQQGHRIAAVRTEKRNGKVQTGNTGVEFRYYKKREFSQLSKAQKDELLEWRKNKKSRGEDAPKKQSNKQKIAALEARLEEQAQTIASLATNGEGEHTLPPPPAAAPPAAPAAPVGILRNPLQHHQQDSHNAEGMQHNSNDWGMMKLARGGFVTICQFARSVHDLSRTYDIGVQRYHHQCHQGILPPRSWTAMPTPQSWGNMQHY